METLRIQTDNSEYPKVLAASLSGAVQIVADRQIGGGIHEIQYIPTGAAGGRRANPGEAADEGGEVVRMRMGRAYFRKPLEEYYDWPERWWREAIQNAVDGDGVRGGTVIKLEVAEEDGAFRISCEDNGPGMTKEVLRDTFLVFGESGKTGKGSTTGGFGKAKELLILPWLKWSIHTQDNVIDEAVADGSIGEPVYFKKGEYLRGTKLTVWMDKEEATTIGRAVDYLKKCYLPNIKFYANGELVTAQAVPGDVIENGDIVYAANADIHAKVCYNKDYPISGQYVYVRANGLFMFSSYVNVKTSIPGIITFDLYGPKASRELLTVNRDGFRDYEFSKKLSALGQKIAIETGTALRKTKGIQSTIIRGSVRNIAAEQTIVSKLVAETPKVIPKKTAIEKHFEDDQSADEEPEQREQLEKPEKQKLTPEQAGKLAQACERIKAENNAAKQPTTVAPNVATALLQAIDFTNPRELADSIAAMARDPDVLIVQELDGFGELPKNECLPPELREYDPKHMTARTRKVFKMWVEMCRFVFMVLHKNRDFGIGFIFSDRVGGECRIAEDPEFGRRQWILINPVRIIKDVDGNRTFKPKYNIRDHESMGLLLSIAIHEATHVANGLHEHDEDFAAALTYNTAMMLDKWGIIRALQRELPKEVKTERRVLKAAKTQARGERSLARGKSVELSEYLEAAARGFGAYAVFVDIGEFWSLATDVISEAFRVACRSWLAGHSYDNVEYDVINYIQSTGGELHDLQAGFIVDEAYHIMAVVDKLGDQLIEYGSRADSYGIEWYKSHPGVSWDFETPEAAAIHRIADYERIYATDLINYALANAASKKRKPRALSAYEAGAAWLDELFAAHDIGAVAPARQAVFLCYAGAHYESGVWRDGNFEPPFSDFAPYAGGALRNLHAWYKIWRQHHSSIAGDLDFIAQRVRDGFALETQRVITGGDAKLFLVEIRRNPLFLRHPDLDFGIGKRGRPAGFLAGLEEFERAGFVAAWKAGACDEDTAIAYEIADERGIDRNEIYYDVRTGSTLQLYLYYAIVAVRDFGFDSSDKLKAVMQAYEDANFFRVPEEKRAEAVRAWVLGHKAEISTASVAE